ncbi:30S ribosomal protein S17e [Candidatus Woesearchaeota archaeon]|nr:30S ribosomal protein S17e [Candidatus Woesearchaeota archaeon]
MGRIKTQLIKRTARKLFTRHQSDIKHSFEENKAVVANLLQNPNKKMRNIIAGYLARLIKQQQEQSKPRAPRPMMSRSPRSPRAEHYTSRPR